MRMLSEEAREAIDDAVARVGPLPGVNTLALDDILLAMNHDKKAEAGRTAFVLPVEVGRVVIRSDVPPQVVRSALSDAFM
jgi:3-dehydroquinate synthetase